MSLFLSLKILLMTQKQNFQESFLNEYVQEIHSIFPEYSVLDQAEGDID